MIQALRRTRPELIFFFILLACVGLANGLSDSVYSNYFKEVYQVSAEVRGFIEFPRELPGLLCALVIALLASMGDLRIAFLAQLLSLAGLTVLGLYTPPFGIMLFFLFVNSMGMHLFMPLQDSIGMSFAEPGQVGRRMGQYASTRSIFGFIAALLVFFGFRYGFFTFATPVKSFFLIGAGGFALAALVVIIILRIAKPVTQRRGKFTLLLRKKYRFYYGLTILHGVQKQIANVFGTWVIVDLLLQKADILALLSMVTMFIGIFFMRLLGRWMDRFGVKRMMYVEALSFICVYILYGFTVWGINSGTFPSTGWPAAVIFVLYVLDRLSMQMAMVKAVYLRSITSSDEEVTATLSMGTSLDHVIAITAAMIGGVVWSAWGSQWVFFMAAIFSLGNLYVAHRVQQEELEPLSEDQCA